MTGPSREVCKRPKILCDFLLFPELKMVLKQKRCNDITIIQTMQLTKCFERQYNCWVCCERPIETT
jgi:hypothetical protein